MKRTCLNEVKPMTASASRYSDGGNYQFRSTTSSTTSHSSIGSDNSPPPSTDACCWSAPFASARRSQPRDASALTEGEMLVVDDMNQLSIHDRNIIYEDLHGVAPTIHEHHRLIEQSLQQLDNELNNLPGNNSAYARALFLNPSYVRDRSFRLMFLRADNFDPHKAAKRIAIHFQSKLQLFGTGKMARRIIWQDLQEESKAAIHQGDMHLFPFHRDRTGRAVLVKIYAFRKDGGNDTIAHYQKFWYLVMSAFQNDADLQRKGLVVVLYSLGATMSHFLAEMKAQRQRIAWSVCLPYRVSGIHFCLEDERLRQLFSVLQTAVPRHLRLRQRSHVGSHMECQYALASFGIGGGQFPVTEGGALNAKLFHNNLEQLRILERQTQKEKERTDATIPVVRNGAVVPAVNDTSTAWTKQLLQPQIQHQHQHQHHQSNTATTTATTVTATTIDPNILEPLPFDSSFFDHNEYQVGMHDTKAMVDLINDPAMEQILTMSSDVANCSTQPAENTQKCKKSKASTAKGRNQSPNVSSSPAAVQPPTIITCASESDVLCGRGIPFQRHAGNLKLMAVIESHRSSHESSTRREKAVIAKKIVQLTKEAGGRFLKRSADIPHLSNLKMQQPPPSAAAAAASSSSSSSTKHYYWVEVDDAIAREKVAMGFRNKKRVTQ